MCQKMSQQGEKTSLVEQGAFAGTKGGKKRVCDI